METRLLEEASTPTRRLEDRGAVLAAGNIVSVNYVERPFDSEVQAKDTRQSIARREREWLCFERLTFAFRYMRK